jgi:predicted O-methyltransferase YrrM
MHGMSVLQDPDLERRLATLHARSDEQLAFMIADYERRKAENPVEPDPQELKQYLSDKLIALDRDKAEFCYQLCRAIGARRIVEAGTSVGVSTLYLAAAVRDTIRAAGGEGLVIGTEYEPEKAVAAKALFEQTQLDHLIDLREGDLRRTLQSIDGPIDFMLVDIWIDMALPALELVAPHLRPGAIVICDNTDQYRTEYAAYLQFVSDPEQGFRSATLPFKGGLEMSVRC